MGHLDGTAPDLLAPAGSPCTPSTDWSPGPLDDGVERIAFVSGPCLTGDLWVVVPDGTELDRLTFTGDVQRVVWALDGTRILAHTLDAAAATNGLRLYDIHCGAGECSVTAATDLDLSSLGLTSVDSYGQMDAAHTFDGVLLGVNAGGNGPADLAILDLSNSPSIEYVARTADDEYAATWGPDDAEIGFTRYSSSTGAAVWILDLATGAETLLSDQYPAYGMDWR